jgi:hypothetical protein
MALEPLEVLAQYAKRYGLDQAKQNEIAEAKLRTARKGGQLLKASDWTPGGDTASRRARKLPEGFT